MNKNHPTSTGDLLPSERRFVAAMQALSFGRFEGLRIHNGELVLDPYPTAVQNHKFGASAPQRHQHPEFELKKQVVEFLSYVRGVERGEIRILQVHDGLPVAMETEHRLVLSNGIEGPK